MLRAIMQHIKRLFGRPTDETKQQWSVINDQRDRVDSLLLEIGFQIEREQADERQQRRKRWIDAD